MSTFPHTNYAPPPMMGQMNMVNGMPPPPSPAGAQQQPQQQQQQQPLAPPQFAQQQQQVLQQKLQQQFPPPTFQTTAAPATASSQPALSASNMSKFMPPSSNNAFAPHPTGANAATGSSFMPPRTGVPPMMTNQQAAPSPMNGPPSSAQVPLRPPMGGNNNMPSSSLPPHMRPPQAQQQQPQQPAAAAPPAMGMNNGGAVHHHNGPPSATNNLINGSANSSRTGSPALPQMPVAAPPPMSKPDGSSSLSGSMQNLNLHKPNGTPQGTAGPMMGAMPPLPPQQQQQQQAQQLRQQPPSSAQQFPGNFQANFKTSALNASSPMPPAGPTAPNQVQSPNVNRVMPPLSNVGAPQQMPPQPSSVYGTSTAPPMMSVPAAQQQLPLQPNMSFPGQPQPQQQHQPQQPMRMPPPAMQQHQNQLNNNQMAAAAAAAGPPTSMRKPMYPTAQMPPLQTAAFPQQAPNAQMQQQQQQQQQPPYGQGMFNGQATNTPLQYQAQAPPQQQPQQQQPMGAFPSGPLTHNPQMSSVNQGFSRLWGHDTIDLMQNRQILTPATLPPPKIVLQNQFHESINCNPNIIRCTIAKIPESNSLLQKSRLPLGILIHPFRDINSLPVIQCPNIVRCRLCRTYINPFVYFVDSKMWKCNLCYRVNELPDDFQFDPATKTYGDVTRRPEVRSSTIEFIAPSEYMLRPPQPAMYLFLFDVSIIAQQSGYLENVCSTLSKHLDDMPGDARAQVGFIAYNSEVHFYSMAEGFSQPHEMTLVDIDDPFLPRPDNLLVNLKECKELVRDLLTQLPKRFADTHDPGSALGAALQVAYKLMQSCGGRISVFQTCLPNKGPGALEAREDPNNRSAKDVAHLNPATDFYKRYALECSGYQIAVDLFLLNQQYSDLATISGISKHSGGCVHHFPLYQKTKPQHVDSFRNCFKRYLVRKIGFEAVMRIRCTRGLQVHTFHGNFFVRSTDLLSLPNVNPDAGYGMQISYEESLTDVKSVCFQAALLYTNSEGERRIRVHTICLPVTGSLSEIMHAADTEAIIGLLSKMAVDRSITSNVADAREAFMNATVDIMNAFKLAQNLPSGQTGQLIAPRSLSLMPMYILALLKHPAFRVGTSTRLDDRVYAMDCMKNLPLDQLMRYIYPEFYNIDALFYQSPNSNSNEDDEEEEVPDLARLQLSAEYLDSRCIFLLDCGMHIIIYVGINVPQNILEKTFGIKSTAELPDYYYGVPNVNSYENDMLKRFILRLNDEKPFAPIVQVIRDTSTAKPQFIEKLVDDRSESSLSYYEFLQHLRTQVK